MTSLFGSRSTISITKSTIIKPTNTKSKIIQPPTKIYKRPLRNEISSEISRELTNSIRVINNEYISNLLNKNYQSIPSDYNKYLNLYNSLLNELEKTKDNNIKILINMTLSGLKASLDSYSLYNENQNLVKSNEILNNKIEEVLSNKNEKNVISNTTGQIEINKTFELAPLFSKYIEVYGMPEFGEGFNEIKLNEIRKILNTIDSK